MEKSKAARVWAVFNVIGYLGTIIINFLANYLPLNGRTTGEISDTLPNLFVPAGLTFSIWGLIYLLLAGFVFLQWFAAYGKNRNPVVVNRIGPFFFLSSLANIGWIFAWHWHKPLLALFCMLAILACLVMIYLRLGIGRENISFRIFFHTPFSVYLGWITVATVANITAVLVDYEWNGFGLDPQVWAVVAVSAAVVIALLMLVTRSDVEYSAVVFWAVLGIYIKRSGREVPADQAVEAASVAGMVLIAAGIVWIVFRRRKERNSIERENEDEAQSEPGD